MKAVPPQGVTQGFVDASHMDCSEETAQTTKFTNPLNLQYSDYASKLLDRSMWFVTKPFRFYIAKDTYVEVPYGFLTDGATIPRPLWWILPPWGSYGQASVVHDILCRTLEITYQDQPKAIDHAYADKVFKKAMWRAGTPRWKCNLMYISVRVFHTLFRSKTPPARPLQDQVSKAWVEQHPYPGS